VCVQVHLVLLELQERRALPVRGDFADLQVLSGGLDLQDREVQEDLLVVEEVYEDHQVFRAAKVLCHSVQRVK